LSAHAAGALAAVGIIPNARVGGMLAGAGGLAVDATRR